MSNKKFVVELTRLEIETMQTLISKRVTDLEAFMLEGVKLPDTAFDTLYDIEYNLSLALIPE